MVKNIFRVLVMSGVMAVVTPATQVVHADEQSVRNSHDERQSIVGSWIGTFDNGERLLISFTSDGIAFSSVQSEVSLAHPVLTPGHGAWVHLGGRRFAMTNMAALYDLPTGADLGFGKLRAVLTLDKTADRISGDATVDLFSPDGTLVRTFPHAFRLTRITVEPVD